MTFNVTGQSELPRVQILNKEFEFGKLYVGSSASLEGIIQNIGAIHAILYLDLSMRPDFRIEFSTDLIDDQGSENKNSITLVSNPIFVTKSNNNRSQVLSSKVSLFSKPNSDDEESNTERASNGLVYKFYLIENSTIKFNLIFQPTEPADHSFELPFTLMNVISSSSIPYKG